MFFVAAPRQTSSAPALPRLQRPDRDLALRYARRLFLQGERVDMNTLAEALGIGRTTLYRWVGDREHLVAATLAGMAEAAFQTAAESARGRGLNRALDRIRNFMRITSEFEPLRSFAEREPQFALRVLLDPEGPIAAELRTGFGRALADHVAGGDAVHPDTIDIMVQLATALEWAPITIGQEPAIDHAIELMRSMLETRLRGAA